METKTATKTAIVTQTKLNTANVSGNWIGRDRGNNAIESDSGEKGLVGRGNPCPPFIF